MTNYKVLRELRPAYDEMSNRANLIHRGEAISFRPNHKTPYHSTDIGGFRHTVFRGQQLSVSEIVAQPKYGIVLGSSHIFGLGMPGNEFTIPSLLSARFGFPFANVSIPEANSRNLFALLAAQLARVRRPPAIVILFSGGDFTSYSMSSVVDPVFGSPNLMQLKGVRKELGDYPPPGSSLRDVEAFSGLWTKSIFDLCKSVGVPFAMGRDTTFFEKVNPTEFEIRCELGKPANDFEVRWFETQREFNAPSFAWRERFVESLGVPFAGPKPPTGMTFLDEFHYDRRGTHLLFEHVAAAIEPLLQRP